MSVVPPARAGTTAPGLLAEPPFFIVGSGRSGTTLMQSLLSAHSRLAVAPETHFLANCLRFGGDDLSRPPADFAAFWQAYRERPRFLGTGIDPVACEVHFPTDRPVTFGDAFATILRVFLDASGKARVGEKTPSHLTYADWLLSTFPGARIIAMQRDPRAVIASQLKAPWRTEQEDLWRVRLARTTRLHAVARDAREWMHANAVLIPALEGDKRVLAVRYEDLVAHPERTLRAVTAHLGEAFEPAMLAQRANTDADPSATRLSGDWVSWLRGHESAARAPVSAGSLAKWRSELTRHEIALIEAITGPAMRALGYTDVASTYSARGRVRALAPLAEAACTAELAARRASRHMLGRIGK